ncbi:Quinone oxidoreductase protein [Globisporangium polare]
MMTTTGRDMVAESRFLVIYWSPYSYSLLAGVGVGVVGAGVGHGVSGALVSEGGDVKFAKMSRCCCR